MRTLDFKTNRIELLSIDELEQTYRENMPDGTPVGGIYHFEFLRQLNCRLCKILICHDNSNHSVIIITSCIYFLHCFYSDWLVITLTLNSISNAIFFCQNIGPKISTPPGNFHINEALFL